jgi:hypothetical protein
LDLVLSDIQKTMVPGAKEILKTGTGYHKGRQMFLQALIKVAIEESDGSITTAARKLGVQPAYISQVLEGKSLQVRGKKKDDPR